MHGHIRAIRKGGCHWADDLPTVRTEGGIEVIVAIVVNMVGKEREGNTQIGCLLHLSSRSGLSMDDDWTDLIGHRCNCCFIVQIHTIVDEVPGCSSQGTAGSRQYRWREHGKKYHG